MFSKDSLSLLLSYIKDRKHRTKVWSAFSNWIEISKGVPQGSVLGPLLFNIYINDLFSSITKTEVCNFADDNTIYDSGLNLNENFANLTLDREKITEWFVYNSLNANPDKFQFIVLSKTESNGSFIWKSMTSKLNRHQQFYCLESLLTINWNLLNIFKNYAYYKLYALRRLWSYSILQKAKVVADSFIKSIQ